LNGAASDDGLPAGSSLTTTWSKVSGAGVVTFSNPNSTTTTASFSLAGTYVLRLTATDGALTATDDVNLTVLAPNQAPVVNAGADQSITVPTLASLTGQVTDDGRPLGSSISVTWTKVSGPGSVSFTNPNAVSTTAGFTEPGLYVLRLTASDSEKTTSDDLSINVNPRPTCFTGDNFNDDAIDLTKWQMPVPSPKVFERNQRLEILPITTSGYVYNGYISATPCNFTGVIATVEVLDTTGIIYGAETFMGMFPSQSNGTLEAIGTDVGGGGILFYYYKNGVRFGIVIGYDRVQHRFWRIRHNPQTDRIIWETSPDNIVWTARWDAPRPFPLTSMHVQLMAGTYLVLSNPGVARFDNFSLRFYDGSNNPNQNQAPTVSAGDDQTTSTLAGTNNNLWVMNGSGSGQTRLTYATADEHAGTWSPDNSKILFSSNRDGNREVYVMNADGLNQRRLTFNPSDDIEPAWSPDGTKILFAQQSKRKLRHLPNECRRKRRSAIDQYSG
jgi:hypothetical protein